MPVFFPSELFYIIFRQKKEPRHWRWCGRVAERSRPLRAGTFHALPARYLETGGAGLVPRIAKGIQLGYNILTNARCEYELLGSWGWVMSEGESMATLVGLIAKKLVDKPDDVKVTEVSGDYSCVIELRVAKEDIGKVIGQKGAHAQAIRTLMMAASGKDGKRYILEILDE
jgi:predicted RNA-binding protein YlqC (UPF0109 family)